MTRGAWAIAAFLVALPLATAAQEVALAGCVVAALLSGGRGRSLAAPWGWAAVACAAAGALGALASGDLREGLGHAWRLAPLFAVPALLETEGARATLERWGLGAAVVVAAWGVGQAALGVPAHAGLSHHLTLAYALLPPLGVAVASGRWAAAAVLVTGVAATGSAGAAVAAVATVAAARWGRPGAWLGAGALATVALLAVAADPGELRERAILWTGGLSLSEGGPVGPGAYAAASALAYDRLAPGFWFPNHAHDGAVQILATLGPAGLLAYAWLAWAALRHGSRGAAAGLAGVLVGALTQDTLGDLEVARAAWAWVALGGVSGGTARRDDGPD